MKTIIYKYPIKVRDKQTISLPAMHTILSAQFQDSQLCVWAEVQHEVPPNDMVEVTIRIYGTGQIITLDARYRNFIGTAQRGGRVWHVFEQTSEPVSL